MTGAVCRVCDGSGVLLTDVCPLCDGDSSFATEAAVCVSSLQNVQRTTQGKCQRCWCYAVQCRAGGSDDLTRALAGDLCDGCAQVVSSETVVQLQQQRCSSCGKHGHVDGECPFKKKRRPASEALAGA